MPRFYLHIRNGHGDLTDTTGVDCTDSRSAVGQAATTAGEIMRDEFHDRLAGCTVRVTVETENHDVVGVIDASLSLPPPT